MTRHAVRRAIVPATQWLVDTGSGLRRTNLVKGEGIYLGLQLGQLILTGRKAVPLALSIPPLSISTGVRVRPRPCVNARSAPQTSMPLAASPHPASTKHKTDPVQRPSDQCVVDTMVCRMVSTQRLPPENDPRLMLAQQQPCSAHRFSAGFGAEAEVPRDAASAPLLVCLIDSAGCDSRAWWIAPAMWHIADETRAHEGR